MGPSLVARGGKMETKPSYTASQPVSKRSDIHSLRPPGVKKSHQTPRRGEEAAVALRRALQVVQNIGTVEKWRGWYYVDDSGDVQGAFDGSAMTKWRKSGDLSDSLPVCMGARGCFMPISALGSHPFVLDQRKT